MNNKSSRISKEPIVIRALLGGGGSGFPAPSDSAHAVNPIGLLLESTNDKMHSL